MHLVSVLFSEPKIPQCVRSTPQLRCRAAFQCSSASRKFLNRRTDVVRPVGCRRFSALQRAENSSIQYPNIVVIRSAKFQCSSASRKFLNASQYVRPDRGSSFQCSSASRKFLNWDVVVADRVITLVSVLFSEPKIPQSKYFRYAVFVRSLFQCSSASRKFLNAGSPDRAVDD